MSETIKFNSEDWASKTTERSKGRMKITFKLNKDEATAFKNWSTMVKPDKVDEELFIKQIFFRGIETLNEMLTKAAKEMMDDPSMKEKLKAQGVDLSKLSVPEEVLADSPSPSGTPAPIYDIKTKKEVK